MPFDVAMLEAFLLALVCGVLIGFVGIGGVLAVSVLTLLNVDIHQAIGASMFSFIFSGAIGAWIYTRKASIEWSSGFWLGGGAAPGALVGSFGSSHANGGMLLVLVGATVIFAGSQVLLRNASALDHDRRLGPLTHLEIGFVVGAASALTGTGGPVLLVPLLAGWMGMTYRNELT